MYVGRTAGSSFVAMRIEKGKSLTKQRNVAFVGEIWYNILWTDILRHPFTYYVAGNA